MEVSITVGEIDNSKDQNKVAAAKILDFPLLQINYVWGETYDIRGNVTKVGKCHISGWGFRGNEDVFLTLCGIEDTPGNWPFAVDSCFDGKDGCKNCKRVLRRFLTNPR